MACANCKPVSHEQPESETCYNCGTRLQGAFCAVCGQKALPLNPGLHEFVHDFTHEMLHVDGKIYRSVGRLLLSPGFLTREQFDGRRARWISPIRLYLIFSILYFAVAALRPTPPADMTVQGHSDEETTTTLRWLGFESEQELQEALSHARAKWLPRVMFVLVPLFAGLLRVAWRRTQRNYPQHLYTALHVHAAWFAAAAVIAGGRIFLPRTIATALAGIAVAYGLWYAISAFRRLYGGNFRSAVVRTAVVLGIYWLAVTVTSVAIAMPVIFFHHR
jgi:hypothetical protein